MKHRGIAMVNRTPNFVNGEGFSGSIPGSGKKMVKVDNWKVIAYRLGNFRGEGRITWFSGETEKGNSRHQQSMNGGTVDNELSENITEPNGGSSKLNRDATKIL